MNPIHQIEAKGKIWNRRAWTGGDTPPDGLLDSNFLALVDAFYQDQLKDSGGLDFWECAGTSREERKEIFMNRARLDAWRTLTDKANHLSTKS